MQEVEDIITTISDYLNGHKKTTKTKNKENYKQKARTLLAGPGKAGCNADLMSNIFSVEITLFYMHCQVRTARFTG